MANILYGVNGEGSGHSTRAKEVISHLERAGHTVHVVSFDRGLRNLKDDFEVTEIYGLRFAYVNDRVRYRRTVGKNLLTVPQAARSLRRLLRQVDDWGVELVITDFEPLSCRVAHRRRLPLISIDNQHCLVNAEISYPREYRRQAAAAKLVTRLMTPGAGAYLAISFFQPPVRSKRTWIFPPILRREVLDARPTTGEHVLVYVTSPSAKLAELLRGIRGRFLLYGFDREGEDGNLTFKKPTLGGFLRDLASCRAVIANAGFSLVSEALYLGKSYLAYPVKRQFEQVFNAYYVDKMGYGAWWDELNKERIESFLFNLDGYREKLAGYLRQDNSALLTRLDTLIAEYLG
jgi:uncharacterized protein (TIGR00661 family)